MTTSFYLIFVLALCSLNFSSIAQAQFLRVDTTAKTAENNLPFNQNTPEEIQTALSANIGTTLNTLGSLLTFKADASQASDRPYLYAWGSVLVDYSNTIGDALGKLVADGVNAFREAQMAGEDEGAAVGAVFVNSLQELNNTAQAIADAVQQEFDTISVAFSNIIPESDAKIFGSIGESFKKGINAFADHADLFGEIVSQVVNDVVSQGGNTAEQLGNAFVGLLQALEDNADVFDEIGREIRSENQDAADDNPDFIKTLNISAEEFKSPVIQFIEIASRKADSTVQVIDNIGRFFIQFIEIASRKADSTLTRRRLSWATPSWPAQPHDSMSAIVEVEGVTVSPP